jgi:hypothetical protein
MRLPLASPSQRLRRIATRHAPDKLFTVMNPQ